MDAENNSIVKAISLVKVYSENQLKHETGLSQEFITQALNEWQASNGRMGLPWFRRGSRRGILGVSFVEYIQRMEREVLLG
jgi:hypothetical protein